jgi:hypothetical protein
VIRVMEITRHLPPDRSDFRVGGFLTPALESQSNKALAQFVQFNRPPSSSVMRALTASSLTLRVDRLTPVRGARWSRMDHS